MKIIGAGYGRTGTVSLQQAFECLGYPCYHMQEVMKSYDRGHVEQWDAVLRGEQIDWQSLFSGYEATVDFPSCIFYRELMAAFPDAVVILSVRDAQAWWKSYSKLLRLVMKTRYFNFVPMFKKFADMNFRLIDYVFDGEITEERCILQYKQHIEEVKATVPKDRLLVYSVTEGWEPLCQFLGHPVPDRPFPHANAGIGELRKKIIEQFWRQGIGKLFR